MRLFAPHIRLGFPLYIDGFKVHAPTNPWYIYREIFYEKHYHFDLPQRPVIYDVGANIGLATLYFKHIRPDAIVHCFEPNPSALDALEKNVTHLSDVHIHPVAISDREGTASFQSNIPASGKARIGVGDITVPTQQLDFEYVDLLKIDVEGAEYQIIPDLAARGLLKKIARLAIEIHGDPEPILAHLTHFTLVSRIGKVWKFVA
ncbi:MAG: FkbM family methyltransferase [Candidatus Pacebacteria bacterium]|nr:FkbM family methyltransferase [Candidatus Paceibacterota bacterium]